MSFELRVEFTGLCLYLVDHPTLPADRDPGDPVDAKKVTVFLPECRKGKVSSQHEDEDKGRAHVGYLRFDLANLASLSKLPAGAADEAPMYEGVHRFTRQELTFGLSDPLKIHAEPRVPEFSRLAPTLKPRAELSDNALVGKHAVMRTTLTGGTLKGLREGEDDWEFSNLFHKKEEPYAGTFADKVVWTRTVDDAADLTLTISNFKGGGSWPLQLVPVSVGGDLTISLRIANLCSDNPLEWPELGSRQTTREDLDFKWLYRLMLPDGKPNYSELLDGKKFPIPVPWGEDRGGQGCVGVTAFVP
jgi:hypothetical protein